MRHVGSIANEAHAKTLQSYLLTRGIRSLVEPENGEWAVWIYDEDQLEAGRDEFTEFSADPNAQKYAAALREADRIAKVEAKRTKDLQKKVVDVRQQWERPLISRCPITFTLIALSVFTAIVTTDWSAESDFLPGLCNGPRSVWLMIGLNQADPFRQVANGEVWRLFTPVFLHFGVIHILFNMMWTRELGSVIEMRRGSLRFLTLVLVTGVVSNVAQCQATGPGFGGMSGVVFGLFAYVWMKSRFDPNAGFYMPPNLVVWVVLWFFLCVSGVIGPIANWAHGVGALVGGLIALMPVFWRKITAG